MKKSNQDPKGFINNHITDVYAIRVEQYFYKEDRAEIMRTESVDIKDFSDLRRIAKELGEENLKAEIIAKEEKELWYTQKILVTL